MEVGDLFLSMSQFLATVALLLLRYWAIRDPVQILRDRIEEEKWFEGVVLSTAFFEGVGIGVLKSHFQGKVASEKIDRIRSVEQIIFLLYASGMIKQPTYSKMLEVNDFRNGLVHFPLGTPRQPLEPKEAKRIIQKAIGCLRILYRRWPTKGLEFITSNPK